MLSLVLGQLIHEERQREIERLLEARRLVEAFRKAQAASPSQTRIATGQNLAGAAS